MRLRPRCTCTADGLGGGGGGGVHPPLLRKVFLPGPNSLELCQLAAFCPVSQPGDRRDAAGIFWFRSCLWLAWGPVWARSAVALGGVTALQVAVCPAQTAKFIFLSSSDLSPQNHLPCHALREGWQCQLSRPVPSHSPSHAPAGLHLLPCVKASVDPPRGGQVSGTNENNDKNMHMDMMWQKRNGQFRSPTQKDEWSQKHSQQQSVGDGEVWDTKGRREEGGQRVPESASNLPAGSARSSAR